MSASRQDPLAHRCLTVVAALSLLVGLRAVWSAATADHGWLGFLVTCGYVVLVVLAVAASVVRSGWLPVVDVSLLALGLGIRLVQFAPVFQGTVTYRVDEGILSNRGAQSLLAGHNPYAYAWPHAVAGAPTQLMGGGIVDRFDYPPLPAALAAGFGQVWSRLATPAFVGLLALAATVVLLFRLLPVPLRPLSIVVVLGFGFDTGSALGGAPAAVALPLLVVALWWWPPDQQLTLGRRGWVGALCLGLACAAQQLAWLLVPFLVLGRLRLRRERPVAAASAYLAVTVGAFLVVNLPFLAAGPRLWWHGVTDVFTQHAVIYGQGVVMLSGFVVHGSGGVAYYSYATGLLYLAAIALFTVDVGRFARALPVLAYAPLLLSIRSEDTYLTVLAPLWLVAAAAGARLGSSPTDPRRLPRPVAVGVPAALGLFATASLVTALATPAPLLVSPPQLVAGPGGRASAASVTVRNVSGHPVDPHFAFVRNATMSVYWTVTAGPTTLPAGQRARYRLAVPARKWVLAASARPRLWVLSDDPQAISVGG